MGSNLKNILLKLNSNLNTLREREARYAGNAPLELLNQIDDHRQAVALTERAIANEITEAEWREHLAPLLVAINTRGGEANVSGVTIGDVQGGIIASEIAGGDISIGQKIVNVFTATPTQKRELRNRQIMLKLVHDFWIEGVLENSLHGAVMLELGMEEHDEAIERPWDMVLQTPDQAKRQLPPSTKIADVFAELGRSLLILGDPGAGKTTTLLELARDTIGKAEGDPTQPIPVVFNLSSWGVDRQPLAQWLMVELKTKYNIPQKIALAWISNDELLILLDGLDEVEAEHRENCVAAINQFQQDHLVPMVVCSRIADYEALNTKLKLQGATLLQSLSLVQIEKYLNSIGPELNTLRALLKEDVALQDLARSPLVLNIMTLAYQNMSVDQLSSITTPDGHRQHLLDTYVQRMFARRKSDEHYATQQTTAWLSFLAHAMARHAETKFQIEQMQPDWLPLQQQRKHYWATVLLSTIIPFCLIVGTGAGIFLNPGVGLTFGVGLGLAIVITIWLLIQQTFGLKGGVIVGGIFGLALGLTFGLNYYPTIGLLLGLPVGMVVGLGYSLIGKWLTRGSPVNWHKIEIVEVLGWSWPRAILGLAIGAAGGYALGYGIGQIVWWPIAHIFALGFGVTGSLLGLLFAGLISGNVEYRVRPNQGIRQSLHNALLIGLGVMISIGLPTGVVSGIIWGILPGRSDELMTRVIVGIATGISVGLISGFIVSLFFGGLAVIQHFVLRFLLWHRDELPWDLANFLNYASDHIFLRRVGGGYIFIHRYLMEYFASLGEENIDHLTK